ncbi:glycoside hydrolase family 72 protein [Xylona heveae TC161]|uniref:1,3-beta-glucanosyltransferase n=1 Tax=Xylona heveae (strain CBS 132557 / TC161) TaxID=1328760 RepID=A0A164ZBU3_XYLHT|nr:glycoside hydrolase family 72 protein [Xylona heveae TC161]KZF18909.1 glycoside hydrolase family 72 protein [Xylona heveae TC161]
MKAAAFASTTIAAVAAFFASTAHADVDPIVIKGSKFFYKTNGTEFFIKGVAYQQDFSGNGTSGSNDYSDPLADPDGCKRDVPVLQELQTNTVRVYAINPEQDHSQCMQMLQDAGIYVIADLSQPGLSINRDSPTWNDQIYARYASVVDSLQNYTNVLGFFAGNEVSNNASNTDASAFVKAAVRDMKAYIKQNNYRQIGVGYATNDDASIRTDLADYFNCGSPEESIDFWGYNIYSWCGDSSYQQSGYADRTQEFSNYSVPAFFAEYGCNTPSPRKFTEVGALYGSEMTPVWSGGIVYMYFQEANDYGLVSIDGNSVSKLDDFTALSSQIAKVTPTGVNAASYTPTNTKAQNCPASGTAWQAATALPPTPNKELCSCMFESLSCVAKSSVSDETVGKTFGYICGQSQSACDGITANGTSGVYGAYSMCNATEQLSWAANAYYKESKQNPSACDFNGVAHTQSPTSAQGACSSLLSQAGTAGTGTVTSVPTGTGAGAASGTKSGSTGTSTHTGAASMMNVPVLNLGMLQLGAYVLGAALTGAGMLLL